MRVLLLILIAVLTACTGQLLLRSGTLQSGSTLAENGWSIAGWRSILMNGRILLGLLMWGVSTLVYLVVLSRTQLSFAYCLGSINYVVVPLAGRWIFQESISPMRLAGMVVIFLGVSLTLWSKILEGAGGR